jgi:NAD(P)-dependent dehydrogenase (short-subunit alcohol dehydrogenase family)
MYVNGMDKKVVLVTGANRGIGKEIVRQLAEQGWQVIVAARNLQAAREVADQIGHDTVAVQLDVRDEQSVKQAAAFVADKFNRLDVLINNAGIMGNDSMVSFDLDQIERTMNTNFTGPIRTAKFFIPLLKNSTDARIINMSSGMGEINSLHSGGYAAYRLSKTSLNAFTILLSAELRNSNVKVFAMCPGWVQTDMGGKGAPRSVSKGAETAVWLASDKSVSTGKFYRDKKVIDW